MASSPNIIDHGVGLAAASAVQMTVANYYRYPAVNLITNAAISTLTAKLAKGSSLRDYAVAGLAAGAVVGAVTHIADEANHRFALNENLYLREKGQYGTDLTSSAKVVAAGMAGHASAGLAMGLASVGANRLRRKVMEKM